MGGRAEEGGPGADLDGIGQAEIEGRAAPRDERDGEAGAPAAGPHEVPELTNPEATPGTGSLPSASDGDEAAGATG